MKNKKPILCIDFDGVIHSYSSGWKGARNIPDPPVPGAMEFLVKAQEHFEVHIFSSRSRYFGARRAMKQWLIKNMENYYLKKHPDWTTLEDPFRDNCLAVTSMAESEVQSLKFPTRKPAAFLTIDDRAIRFVGVWPEIKQLKRFKPWNKGEV